jgi:hypothetical protein
LFWPDCGYSINKGKQWRGKGCGRVRAIAIHAGGHLLLYWQGAWQQIAQKQTNYTE